MWLGSFLLPQSIHSHKIWLILCYQEMLALISFTLSPSVNFPFEVVLRVGMFHGLWIWLILVLGFRALHLNLAGFRVLQCVTGCAFGQFLCSGFDYFIQNSYPSGFPGHTVHVVPFDRKPAFECLNRCKIH